MDKPLVSVVIPTYGRPLLLERCIDSVLHQTYKNIEIIVVDDNDPDADARKKTEEIMQKYLGNPMFIYLQHDRNRNGSAARNTGLRAASGKYITFVDDDDELKSKKISRQVSALESRGESWVACYTAYEIIKGQGNKKRSSEHKSGDCYIYALMRTMFMGSGSNLLIRKSIVDEIKGYDESFSRNQDIEFLVRVLEKGKLIYIDEVLLEIHQEDRGRKGHTFEEIDRNARMFLVKYRDNMEKLSPKEKKRVISVISLERCKIAFRKKEYRKGMSILFKNRVRISIIMKYLLYLAYRFFTKKSQGFTG